MDTNKTQQLTQTPIESQASILTTMNDSIHHPNHYNWHPTGIECKDIAEHFNFNLGMAIKYIWRAGHKTTNPIEDLQKSIICLQYEIERIQKYGT